MIYLRHPMPLTFNAVYFSWTHFLSTQRLLGTTCIWRHPQRGPYTSARGHSNKSSNLELDAHRPNQLKTRHRDNEPWQGCRWHSRAVQRIHGWSPRHRVVTRCAAPTPGASTRAKPRRTRARPRAPPATPRRPTAAPLQPAPSRAPRPAARRCLPGRGGDHGGGGLCKVPKPARELRERGARTRPAAPSSREPRAPRAREAGAAGRASRDPHADRWLEGRGRGGGCCARRPGSRRWLPGNPESARKTRFLEFVVRLKVGGKAVSHRRSHHLTHIAAAAAAKSLQSRPTLCDPMDGSPPGSPVPRILQARTLEWVAFSSPMHESEKWKWSPSVVSDS